MGYVFNRGSGWYAQFIDEHGRRVQKPTKQETKAAAKKWLATVEARIAQGKVGIVEKRKERTFGEALTHWLETHSRTELTSHKENAYRAEKHLRPAFGSLPLSAVTAERVDMLKAKMQRETKEGPNGKPVPKYAIASINHVVQLTRKVLNDCARWGWTASAPKLRLIKKPEAPFNYLRKEEAIELLRWARDNAKNDFALYAVAIYVGPRMGELYGMRWTDVALDQGRVTLRWSYNQPHTKSKKIRHVELPPNVVAILRAWEKKCPESELGLVFPQVSGSIRAEKRPPASFAEALKAAGVKRKTKFHDLRHTAASLLVMAGVNLRTVQRVLGHSTIQMTERYAHLAPDFNKAEVAKLSLDLDLAPRGKLVAMEGGRS